MKRSALEWAMRKAQLSTLDSEERGDILDSDARQRAEIRDLRARLKAIAAAPFGRVIYTREDSEAFDLAERAVDLTNKKWRTP